MGASEQRKERKVVTVLFADLVGFTARAESLDPEDVEAILAPYHEQLRRELERFGGTVEKFIGDAVMALFGAPVAHEDDPERAVRAALAIRDWAREEGVEVRIAVNTGEALVRLGARPEWGEGMAAGDVVNTAARLQAAAPANGILVGQTTFRATRETIDHVEREPVHAQGKAEPVRVWEALQARSRLGVDVARSHPAPLVGRERELAVLREALARTRGERSPQFVTVVGAPGLGKSRLVYELMQAAAADLEFVTWRQGRSLPYGEGVSFWALAEIVKAQAGILDGDAGEAAEAKLARVVEEAAPEDAASLVRHLRPLVGLGDEDGTGSRGASFVAWRRFLEGMAERTPTVVVFEDLHWADDGLLDFVDHLAEWAVGVPLLVVGTARPELLERRPTWGGGKLNVTTLALSPLSEAETALLLDALLERPLLAETDQAALLMRAGGNPLYAEQFASMLRERVGIDEMPETVHGIIAARLDGLASEEKGLLQDASVVGKVFWSGALAALGGAESESIEQFLHRLERKDLIQRARRSSVADSSEHQFRHVLVRDVAYAQIPRLERSKKHWRVAEWLGSLGRPDEHAEPIAHHYATALELARAAGGPDGELMNLARCALRDAGDRALGLNSFSLAARYYERALVLWPIEDAVRPHILFRYGSALRWAEDRGEDELAEARDGLVAAGEREVAIEVDLLLADLALNKGRRPLAADHLKHAATLADSIESSRAEALVLGHRARFELVESRYAEAIRLGLEALPLAEQHGLQQLYGHVLNTVGTARASAGDPAGLAELERSLELARTLDSGPDVLRAHNNLMAALSHLGELGRECAVAEEALASADHYGEWAMARAIRANLPVVYFFTGRWDDAARLADEFIAEVEAGAVSLHVSASLGVRGSIRAARGDLDGALADLERVLARSRADEDLRRVAGTFGTRAFVLLVGERVDEAAEAADEWLRFTTKVDAIAVGFEECAALLELGRDDELRALLEHHPSTVWAVAARHAVNGNFKAAAEVYARAGIRVGESWARLRAARRLFDTRRHAEADEQLRQALAFYRSVGATHFVREAEALLARTA